MSDNNEHDGQASPLQTPALAENDSQPERLFHPPQPGMEIWHQNKLYTIGEPINRGNFGAIYACSDEWGNQLVAKVLVPRNQSYEEVRSRWLDEADKLLHLRHPNTTYIYDICEHRDTFYIIMERCEWTLHDIITATPNYDGSVWFMPIARCILQAIHFMHRHGYVHKDLHHKNIFTSLIPNELVRTHPPAMVFKVGDFGISRLEGDIDPINTILAQWMLPPESLAPQEFGHIGRVTDIYHMGLLFLSIIEGQIREFSREEILDGVPRQIAEGLDSPYSRAIAKALRRHTADRTRTALEFWRDLNSSFRTDQSASTLSMSSMTSSKR
ncbi:protein kinase [Myxococcus sp. CA056]|uniref:serine/threonine protein kinase n=1 Tax=Myxococcus sp. CA056 TaxID=2741740 RepID=UPI00157A62A6|nr:protein kinase [Myxococcus sp. CA056]NTX15497.1 protein kinase [Myxococcus sp. CA056]